MSLFDRWNDAGLIDVRIEEEEPRRIAKLTQSDQKTLTAILTDIEDVEKKMPKPTREESATVYHSLDTNGLAKWPTTLPKDIMTTLIKVASKYRSWATKRYNRRYTDPEYDTYDPDNEKRWGDYVERTNRIDINAVFLRRLLQSAPWIPAVEKYFGDKAICVQTGFLDAEPMSEKKDQTWHRDYYRNPRELVNVFIYLVDGSNDLAPTQMLPRTVGSVPRILRQPKKKTTMGESSPSPRPANSFAVSDSTDDSWATLESSCAVSIDVEPETEEQDEDVIAYAEKTAKFAVSMYGKKGEAVLWDGRTIHRGMRNKTKETRHCIYATYVAKKASVEYIDTEDYDPHARCVDPLRSDFHLPKKTAAIREMRQYILSKHHASAQNK